MFNTPVRYVPMEENMEQLKEFSYWGKREGKAVPLTYDSNNGQLIYVDENKFTYVTPARKSAYEVLEKNNYQRKEMFVPFSNGEQKPIVYQWLQRMVEENEWNDTFSAAYIVATQKGIKKMDTDDFRIAKIKDVTIFPFSLEVRNIMIASEYEKIKVSGMIYQHLMNETRKNIGTFICLDSKNVLVCDEYGRTFLVEVKGTASDFVNALIDAGYTRTVHPERYVQSVNEK